MDEAIDVEFNEGMADAIQGTRLSCCSKHNANAINVLTPLLKASPLQLFSYSVLIPSLKIP